MIYLTLTMLFKRQNFKEPRLLLVNTMRKRLQNSDIQLMGFNNTF